MASIRRCPDGMHARDSVSQTGHGYFRMLRALNPRSSKELTPGSQRDFENGPKRFLIRSEEEGGRPVPPGLSREPVAGLPGAGHVPPRLGGRGAPGMVAP